MVTNFVMVMDMSRASHEQMRGFIEVGVVGWKLLVRMRNNNYKIHVPNVVVSDGHLLQVSYSLSITYLSISPSLLLYLLSTLPLFVLSA